MIGKQEDSKKNNSYSPAGKLDIESAPKSSEIVLISNNEKCYFAFSSGNRMDILKLCL